MVHVPQILCVGGCLKQLLNKGLKTMVNLLMFFVVESTNFCWPLVFFSARDVCFSTMSYMKYTGKFRVLRKYLVMGPLGLEGLLWMSRWKLGSMVRISGL